MWKYLEICGRTSDQGAASSHVSEEPVPVQVPRGSRQRDRQGLAGDATPGSSGTDSADKRGHSSTAVHASYCRGGERPTVNSCDLAMT